MTQMINTLKVVAAVCLSAVLAALFLLLSLAGILFLGGIGTVVVSIRLTYVVITAWLDYCKEEIKEKL